MKIRAVYSIENISDNKVYIGSSINTYDRWVDHKKLLRNNKHENSYLQRAWNKYGEDVFIFSLIECVSDNVNLREKEQFWLDKFWAYEKEFGYNICIRAGTIYGMKRSKETCLKLSLIGKGKKLSAEHCKAISDGLKGRVVSQETKDKIAKSNTGKRLSLEQRKKLSEARIKPFTLNVKNEIKL